MDIIAIRDALTVAARLDREGRLQEADRIDGQMARQAQVWDNAQTNNTAQGIQNGGQNAWQAVQNAGKAIGNVAQTAWQWSPANVAWNAGKDIIGGIQNAAGGALNTVMGPGIQAQEQWAAQPAPQRGSGSGQNAQQASSAKNLLFGHDAKWWANEFPIADIRKYAPKGDSAWSKKYIPQIRNVFAAQLQEKNANPEFIQAALAEFDRMLPTVLPQNQNSQTNGYGATQQMAQNSTGNSPQSATPQQPANLDALARRYVGYGYSVIQKGKSLAEARQELLRHLLEHQQSIQLQRRVMADFDKAFTGQKAMQNRQV